MGIESGETVGATDIGQLVNPGQSFVGLRFDGEPISLTHFKDEEQGAIEPRNPTHNQLIVEIGERMHHYTWRDVLLLGKGEPLFGIGRLYQVYAETEDPEQAGALCDEAINHELALVSE